MLKVDPTLNHIPARRAHVVALFESINQPLVNIPSHGTAPTAAYVLGTRNDQGRFTVFVYLSQAQTGAAVVYVCEPRGLTREQYRAEEAEAIRFVESMGFLVDNVHFPTLPPHEQDAVIERSPLFRPPSGPGGGAASPSGTPAPAAAEDDALFGGLSAQDSEVFQRLSQPPETVQGRPAEPPPEPPAEATPPERAPPSEQTRARLGRLFGMFAALVALGSPLGCTTTQSTVAERRSLESHVDLGNQQLARGMWADAVRTFSQVLEDDEDHRDALRGMGMAYLNLGRPEEAEGYYRQAVEVDKAWSIPKNELAVVLLQRGECAEAQTLLEEVLEDIFYATPEFAEHNLARAQACQGRTGEALKRLDNLLVRRPQFCLGYLTMAQLALSAERYETTVQACDDFVVNCEQNEKVKAQIAPEHSAQCHLRKGLAFARMGDVESARAAFSQCTSKGPSGRECRKSLKLLPP